MSTIGLVTIGQAPRVDVTPDIIPLLAGLDVVETGALDELDADGIAALAPTGDEERVVSRLRDGGSATMSEHRVLTLVQAAVDRAVAQGAEAILVLCTGHLPGVTAEVPVYTAEQLGRGGMGALAGGQRLGVLVPEPEQVAVVGARWRDDLGTDAVVVDVNPYTADDAALAAGGRALGAAGAEIIFLDCIGYSERMAAIVSQAAGVPALTARSLAARLVAAVV